MVAESEEIESESRSVSIDCPVLVTERLVLRIPRDDDVTELVELANNRRLAEMLGRLPNPYRVSDAHNFLSNIRTGAINGCTYAITLSESGAFIGCAGLENRAHGLEIGYWVGEPYWGRGYATEAAHALVDLAFRATDIDRLTVSCRVTNTASRRVAEKLGFRQYGEAPDYKDGAIKLERPAR